METINEIKIGNVVTQNFKFKQLNPKIPTFTRNVVFIDVENDIAHLDEDVVVCTLKNGKEIKTKMIKIDSLELCE